MGPAGSREFVGTASGFARAAQPRGGVMATPMQYRLVNDLLSMPLLPEFRASDIQTRSSVAQMVSAVRNGVPIVDFTDCIPIVQRETAAGKFKLARESIRPLIAPFSETGIIPMAWPRVLMTCADHKEHSACLFLVEQQGHKRPGYGLLSHFAVAERSSTGVVPMLRLMSHEDWFLNAEVNAIMVALALASARNASWVDTAPNRAMRKHYPAVSGVRFRHIEIDMGKPKRTGDRSRDDAEAGVPWHHRRGHWAYYSPEKPLFGRAGKHGWYWRPYTEVGDRAHGTIVQDYSVAGNLPA